MGLHLASFDDKLEIERTPLPERWSARTVHDLVATTAGRFPDRPALSFQIKSGPTDKAETLCWREVLEQVNRAANLFRRLGVGQGDGVAYLLPNCNEAAITLLGAATAGVVCPINPLLDAEQIASILRESDAKVLVTLAPFPKTDVADKAAAAVAKAPNVKTIIEIDLKRYLAPPLSWIVPLIRPKAKGGHAAKVLDFHVEMGRESASLDFPESKDPQRICARFHTGGTTGMPKIAEHDQQGMIYNGWLGANILFTEEDVLLCPLPLFHVFAAYPIWMVCITSGAHMVMPTPAGYRGEGVFDNFWKLIERWGVTFMITVPTAAAALMQRPVNADVSTLSYAISGSAPLPQELFKRFETATGVKILEGYGMTEATCLVSCNPPEGQRKIGSVGLPFPYTEVKILHCDGVGNITRECGVDEVGEICVSNPGVRVGATYKEPEKNVNLFAAGKYVRTGDLGRLDADGYLWITGRAKDLIIRGGHNIDPAEIEEALSSHPAVAFVGAVGQPDAHSGELPCAYVELVEGAAVTEHELLEHANARIHERAAWPKHLEVLPELPKTAVGKVFKPALRAMAIKRVYDAALKKAGIGAEVDVVEDKKLGLVADVLPAANHLSDEEVREVLGAFPRPFRIVES